MKKAQKDYVKRHPDRPAVFQKKFNAKLRQLWGNGLGPRANSKESERLGLRILTNLGFTELVWISEHNNYFPFDIIGRDKNDKLCLFEVTTALHREVETRLMLKKSLRAIFYALFITPKMDRYVLKEVSGKSIALTLRDIEGAVHLDRGLWGIAN